jgi:putative inorganic carbon (hco3(-)) transporter
VFSSLIKNDDDYPQVSNLTLLAFCGYVVIWYLQIGYRIPILGAIRFEFLYAALLSFVAILFNNKIELDCPLIGILLLFLLVLCIQIPFSCNVEVSWNMFIDRVVKFAFMAVFIICFVRSPKHLFFFLGAFILACMKMGQEGLVGQITGDLVWENQGVMRLNGSTPLYSHPNSFSGMALGTIPFIIYLFPLFSLFIKGILLVQFILAFNIILHTGSRTGYVAFCLLLLFALLRSKKKLKALLVLISLAILSIPFIDKQYVERFESIFTEEEKEGQSIETRKQILSDAINIFREHPFGVGVSAFPTARAKYFGRNQDTHNLYLEVATNLGIQGLIVFIILIVKMMRCLSDTRARINMQKRILLDKIALIKAKEDGIFIQDHVEKLRFMEAVANAVIMFLIVRLILGMFGMDLYEIYWWFSVGLTVALFNMNKYSEIKSKKILKMLDPSP